MKTSGKNKKIRARARIAVLIMLAAATAVALSPGIRAGGKKFLADGSLNDYVIIYDEDNFCSVKAAHTVADAIGSYCGVSMTLRSDKAPETPWEIVIGCSAREGMSDIASLLGRNCWTVKEVGRKLYITGDTPLTTVAAAEELAAGMRKSAEPFLYLSKECVKTGTATYISSPTASVSRAEGSDLRIMSFNILSETYNNKLPIENRDTGVGATVLTYLPDAIGFEEVTGIWHETLEEMLDGLYAFVPDDIPGSGRSMSAIMYNTQESELLEYGTVPYSASSNKALRNLTWARFCRLSDGQEYIVTCTHWDINSNAENRKVQVKENTEWTSELIKKYGVPFFCCGDYNRGENTEEFQSFLSGTGMVDTKLTAIKNGCAARGGTTSHTVGKAPTNFDVSKDCIDHIVITTDVQVLAYSSIIDTKALNASDHLPIIGDYKIGK